MKVGVGVERRNVRYSN